MPQAPQPVRDWVAIILSIGLATAINVITAAALWDAIQNDAGLSENATQILTTAFGGIVGVLGGFIGFKAGESQRNGATYAAPLEPGAAPPVDLPPIGSRRESDP
jgi:hypothetical protein